MRLREIDYNLPSAGQRLSIVVAGPVLMKRSGTSPGILFRLVVPVCAVFIMTILALIASVFGNPQAPISGWLDRHAGVLLTGEFLLTIVLIGLAMVVDRVQTLRQQRRLPSGSPDRDTKPEPDSGRPAGSGNESEGKRS